MGWFGTITCVFTVLRVFSRYIRGTDGRTVLEDNSAEAEICKHLVGSLVDTRGLLTLLLLFEN